MLPRVRVRRTRLGQVVSIEAGEREETDSLTCERVADTHSYVRSLLRDWD